MTTAEEIESRPPLLLPPRPARPPSTLQLLKIAGSNSLSAWDQELFEELFVERRYFWGRLFIISHPDGIRRVLQDNYDNYSRLNSLRRIYEFGSGTGMLCAEGDKWRQHRRLINPILDPRAVMADVPLLIKVAQVAAEILSSIPCGQEIDIGRTLAQLVTVSNRHVFTTDDREIEPMLDRLGHFPSRPSVFHLLRVPEWLPFFKHYSASLAEARSFQPALDRLIAQRRSAGYTGRRDLLWRLVHARDRNRGEGLNLAEILDETLTLGATSSTSLRPLPWVWYLLAMHPWVEEKLHAELDSVLGRRPPTAEDLPKLVYLRQVLDETMRLYPPLPSLIMRTVTADDVVCGHRIPRKSIVVITPWVLHRHRKLWRDPDRFDPERFSPEQAAARPRYSYLPFSIGPHVCVGASMAMMEMIVAVAVLAQHFRFRLVPDQQITPTAWINLRPDPGIRMTVEPRVAASASG